MKTTPEIIVTLFIDDQQKVVTSYPYSMANAAFDLFKQYLADGKKASISSL